MEKERTNDIQVGVWVIYNFKIEGKSRVRKVLEVQKETLVLMGLDGYPYKGYKIFYRIATLEEIRIHQLKSIFEKQ